MDVIAQSWYLDLGTRWFYWVPVPLPVPLQATDFAAKECTEGRSAIDGSLNALKGRQMRRTVRTCSIGKDQRCPKNGGIKHWIKGPIFWTLMGHMMVDPMSFFLLLDKPEEVSIKIKDPFRTPDWLVMFCSDSMVAIGSETMYIYIYTLKTTSFGGTQEWMMRGWLSRPEHYKDTKDTQQILLKVIAMYGDSVCFLPVLGAWPSVVERSYESNLALWMVEASKGERTLHGLDASLIDHNIPQAGHFARFWGRRKMCSLHQRSWKGHLGC